MNKQFILLDEKTVLEHTLAVFAQSALIKNIVLVVRAGEEDICRELLDDALRRQVVITTGGNERQDSVRNGLSAIAWPCDYVFIHDGARALITEAVLERTLNAATVCGAAACGVAVKDTIKQTDERGMVLQTIPRESLWAVQTPQVFRLELIREAYRYADSHGYYGTDDASLVEYAKGRVQMVEGDYENIKLTTPEDVALAQNILAKRKEAKQ